MPVLNIEGRRVRVDDNFTSLSPEAQQATVDEIAGSLGLKGQERLGEGVAGQKGDRERVATEAPMGALGASNQGLLQGMTLGFGDELMAGAFAIPEAIRGGVGIGEGYNRALEREREQLNRAREAAPVSTAAGELAGAIGTGAAAGAGGLTMSGRLGTGLAGRSAAAATEGAAFGGLYGAGAAQGGAGERLSGAGEGALYGGAIGGAFPAAAALTVGGARAARNAVQPVTETISNRVMPQDRAASLVSRAFEADRVPMSQAGDRLRQMNTVAPDGVMADVGGSNVRDLARAAVNIGGPAREKVLEDVTERALKTPQRVADVLGETLGNPSALGQTTARIAATRERVASPIYEAAFNAKKPVNVSGVVAAIDREVAPGVNRMAQPMADLRPDGITATLGRLRGFFQTASNQRVDLRSLHRVKMEIDDMISSAKRSGDNMKARALLGVQRQLVNAMEKASPAYRKARGIYSSTHEMEDALEIGRNAFRSSPDEMKAALAEMTPGEKEMARIGLADAIRDRIAGQRDGRDVLKAVFGTPKIRDTIRPAFPDDQAFRRFQSALMKFEKQRRTYNTVTGNSTTAKQLNDMMGLQSGGDVGMDAIAMLTRGQIGPAIASTLRRVVTGEPGIGQKTADAIADMLLSQDPTKINNAIRLLRQKEGTTQRLMDALRSLDTPAAAAAGEIGAQ